MCDGPDGRDSSASRLFAGLALSSAQLNEQIARGLWSLLFRIQEYNGLPDDHQVTVSWLVPIIRMEPPLWDGTDYWGINGSCLNRDEGGSAILDSPVAIDRTAYVTGGRLVASVRTGAQLTLAGGFTFIARDTYVVANLTQADDAWKIDFGVVGGVLPAQDLLATLPTLAPGGQPLCTDNHFYPMIKQNICRERDILAGVGLPSAACDSISFAFRFAADPARLGVAWDPPAVPNPCTPTNDPRTDSCD
jgi:hypothetical protein